MQVFGFPLAGLRSDGLSVNRPWHSEVISVTAFSDKFKLLSNVLVTEALTKLDQKRPVRYEGNVLLLFSGLDPKVRGVPACHLSHKHEHGLQAVISFLLRGHSARRSVVCLLSPGTT